MQQGRLTRKEVGERFNCFGVDGVSFFEGCCTKVISQLKEKHSPYMMGHHCMVHKTNYVMQAFSNLLMVSKLEDLLQFMYAHYLGSPKCHLESLSLSKSWK